MVKRNRLIKRNNPPIKFIQLNQKTAKVLRKRLYMKQGGRCPVLGKKIDIKDAVLDHRHKLKKQKPGPLGRGLVRGVLHYQINGFEGMVLKKYKRQGLTHLISLPELLRNLAHYLENPTAEPIYIYPSEKPPAKTFGKRDYDKIVKWYTRTYPRRKKIPEYPKSGIKVRKSKVKGKTKITRTYKAKLSDKWRKMLEAANGSQKS